jgi:toxin ParE1/3/4
VARVEFRLSPRAEKDLEDIWRYTEKRWSVEQAEKYVGGIIERLEALAQQPTLGRAADDIRAGYLRQNVGSHVVFYKSASYGISVIRILHQRMDFDSHFE